MALRLWQPTSVQAFWDYQVIKSNQTEIAKTIDFTGFVHSVYFICKALKINSIYPYVQNTQLAIPSSVKWK